MEHSVIIVTLKLEDGLTEVSAAYSQSNYERCLSRQVEYFQITHFDGDSCQYVSYDVEPETVEYHDLMRRYEYMMALQMRIMQQDSTTWN